MKPKIDQINGYLTPQASRRKSLGALGSKAMSGSKLQDGSSVGNLLNLDQSLVQKLLDDPIKRKLIVDLITSHKDQIDEYKKTRGLEGVSVLRKVQTKPTCESPTALFRRRAMEQQERATSRNESDSQSSNSRPNSALSGASVVPSPVPFNKILDGVIAFVEVQTNGNDRSQGVKIRIKEMGATVRDQFTKDVTHVIFKDGFFTTYKKAQLIKAHIVSVLWIEACRNEGVRVPEKKYPAIGPDIYDCNASALCSQMQKEYEEVIRDELNKSFTTGAPLPSKQDLINRRRTLMSQSVLKTFSQEFPSSQDFEVAEIFRKSRRTLGPLYTDNYQSRQDSSDDESDLRVVINGPVTKLKDISASCAFNSSDENVIDSSCMDFTELHGTVITHSSRLIKAKENMQPIQDSACIKTPNLDRTKSSVSSYATAVDSESHKGSPTIKNTSGIKILSKNVCSPRVDVPNECVSSAMSTLQISDKTKTTSTTMSSLRVSSDSKVAEVHPRNDEFVTVRKKPAQNEGVSGCSPPKKQKTGQDSDVTPSGLVNSIEDTGDVATAKKDVQADIQSSKQLDKGKNRRKSKNLDKATESAEADKIPTTTNNLTDRPKRTRKSVYNSIDQQTKPVIDNESTDKQTEPTTDKETSTHKDDLNSDQREKPKRTRKSIYNTIDKLTKLVLDDNIHESGQPKNSRKSLYPTNNKQNESNADNKTSDHKENSNSDQRKKPKGARKTLYPDNNKQIVPSAVVASKEKPKVDSESVAKPEKVRRSLFTLTSDNSTGGSSDEKQTADQINSAKKKVRKLFNPDDIPGCGEDVCDDQEREKRREEAKRRKSDGVFIRPTYINVKSNVFVSQKAKEYIDQQNANIDDVLNKQTDSDSEKKTTKTKKKQATEKKAVFDDRFSPTKGIFAKTDDKPTPSRKSVRLSRKPRKTINTDHTFTTRESNPASKARSRKLAGLRS